MDRIIIAGFGGQGVLSLGKLIAEAAMTEGKEVSWLPSYGPEMRGGTSNCSVCVDSRAIASPIIASPDTLIAMNKPSLDKFINNVRPGGCVIVNSSLIPDKVERTDIRVLYVDANDLALKVNNTRAANLVIFGAYVKMSGTLDKDNAIETIKETFAKKPKFIPSNIAAFEIGYDQE